MADEKHNSFLKSTQEKDERLEALKQLYPELFADGKLNIDVLKEVTGLYNPQEERTPGYYGLYWPGKREAKIEAKASPKGTLVPVPGDGVDEERTHNIYIEGDNLEVLRILRQSYKGRVKMIYIDPPYNTGNDFIYPDNYKMAVDDYLSLTGQTDDKGKALTTNQKSNGAFHTKWLNMMLPRLMLARELLTEDGVIFISIDDNEQANLKLLCDDVFGEENFVAQINWKGRGGRQDSKYYAAVHEYILCYAKEIDNFVAGEEIKTGDVYPKYDEEQKRFYKTQLLRKWGSNSRREDRPNLYYPIKAPDGTELYPIVREADRQRPSNFLKFDGRWRWSPATMTQAIEDGRVEFQKTKDGDWIAYEKIFAPKDGDEKTKKYTTWIEETNDGANVIKSLFPKAVFDYPKSPSLIEKFLKMGNLDENEIVLDFFSGSATTAHATMQLNAEDGGNRKFIMVNLPYPCDENSEAFKAGYKNICEIGKERIRRAGAKIREEMLNQVQHDKTAIQMGGGMAKPLDGSMKGSLFDDGALRGVPAEGVGGNGGAIAAEGETSPLSNNYKLTTNNYKLDTGFRVYRLAPTNFTTFTPTTGQDEKAQSELFAELEKNETPLVENWNADNVLTEIILKQGFALDCECVKADSFAKNTVYRIKDSEGAARRSTVMYVCLDAKIEEETISALTLEEKEKFVCLDAAIDDTSYAQLCDKGRIETI